MSNERLKGKAEEIKGNVKQGVGRLIGDEQLEAQGQVDELEGQGRQEAAKAAEQLKGAGEQVKGAVKGAVGDLVDDPKLQAEGDAEQLKGQARQKANQ
jgi:uncharacterized protein YjbJ (UPF0337 family)